uniref:G-protein coupled receptors family 1 profile domain-containing protein n=1 Tax=Acrobeloides nanus TaxID=290746 RepID=A0A914CKZ1_9BILA
MASNTTPFDTYSSVLSVCYTYSALGFLAVCCNLFVLLVYISKSSIRTRYVLFCFIALADLINGLGFLMTGIKRSFKIWALNNSTEFPITYRYQCALEFNTTFMLVGSQWPALLISILGVERFIAVTFPRKYFEISKHYLSISLTSLVLVTFSLFLALFMGIILQRNDLGAYLCTMTASYGWEYS